MLSLSGLFYILRLGINASAIALVQREIGL